MAKLTLNDIFGQYASAAALNVNFALIEDALENTLSLDGTSPNAMTADLDINSNNLLNVNTVNAVAVQIGGVSVVPGDTLSVATAANVPNVAAGNIAATDVQSALNELDTEKVGIAGTETITGNKTFSGAVVTMSTVNNQGAVDNDSTVNNDGVVTNNSTVINKVGSDVVSAAALTLGVGNYFDVTGTISVTSIGTKGVGTQVTLQFDGVLTLTHHTTDLILPGAANITTAAGDIAVLYEYAIGDWRCISYTRAAALPFYEEGTWTPTLQDVSYSDAEGQTYSVQLGTYTKIGNRVSISGLLVLSGIGTLSGSAFIGGLPFTAGATHYGSASMGQGSGLSLTAGTSLSAYIVPNADELSLRKWDATIGTSTVIISDVTASGNLSFFGQYLTDA